MDAMRRTLLVASLIALPVLMTAATPADTVLTVQGRASATPSIAANGSFVAIAWTAAAPGGATDVFLATSRDAGATFGKAVRVNDVLGAVSVSGEQPPRVVLIPPAASANGARNATPPASSTPNIKARTVVADLQVRRDPSVVGGWP